MELRQAFTVPVPVERAWDALLDPERIAPCMPDASLESVQGDAFTGNVKIRLGPINLSYRGQARYVTMNADTRTIVIQGTGKDAKGGGAASATVTAVLTGDGDRTAVATTTDLDVTGPPAQFGRGVMNDVANKLVGQDELDVFGLLGLSPVARRRLAAALILADVFVLGWAIGRLGNRR
jgi:carbon monoxide dehydrogenase subunit G